MPVVQMLFSFLLPLCSDIAIAWCGCVGTFVSFTLQEGKVCSMLPVHRDRSVSPVCLNCMVLFLLPWVGGLLIVVW